jgi:hypothetical protein
MRDNKDLLIIDHLFVQTLVTTATLTGKTRSLQAYDGDEFQVNLLSAAEAYVPPENTEQFDAMELVQSQLVSGAHIFYEGVILSRAGNHKRTTADLSGRQRCRLDKLQKIGNHKALIYVTYCFVTYSHRISMQRCKHQS